MQLIEERPAALPFRPRSEGALETGERGFEELALRQRRRDAKLLAEASRPLDPWERYRALVDAFEQGVDLSEIADRKVRFAMVVMASLNLGLFALATRPELLGVSDLPARGWLGAYLLAYAIVAVYFLVQAVDALRPRRAASDAEPCFQASRLRQLEAVVAQAPAAYAGAWRDVRFDELHNELALQNHRLSRENEEKYQALGRLYGGLRVLALLFGGLVLFAGLSSVQGSLAG